MKKNAPFLFNLSILTALTSFIILSFPAAATIPLKPASCPRIKEIAAVKFEKACLNNLNSNQPDKPKLMVYNVSQPINTKYNTNDNWTFFIGVEAENPADALTKANGSFPSMQGDGPGSMLDIGDLVWKCHYHSTSQHIKYMVAYTPSSNCNVPCE